MERDTPWMWFQKVKDVDKLKGEREVLGNVPE